MEIESQDLKVTKGQKNSNFNVKKKERGCRGRVPTRGER